MVSYDSLFPTSHKLMAVMASPKRSREGLCACVNTRTRAVMVGGEILGGRQSRGVAHATYVRIEVLVVGELEQLWLVLLVERGLSLLLLLATTRQNPDGRSREATTAPTNHQWHALTCNCHRPQTGSRHSSDSWRTKSLSPTYQPAQSGAAHPRTLPVLFLLQFTSSESSKPRRYITQFRAQCHHYTRSTLISDHNSWSGQSR